MLYTATGVERHLLPYLWAALGVFASYIFYKGVYNLYFHPLSGFPGPKIAAFGGIYEFWFDIIKDGRYLWKIEDMHQKYGPIVRVNATELHIRDSNFYHNIYTSGRVRKVSKDSTTCRAIGFPTSVLATVDHELHRARRGYLSPYFSKRSMISIEPMIYERINRLCQRLESAMAMEEVVNLDSAFQALSADIVTKHFYGDHCDYLGRADFRFTVAEAIEGSAILFNLTRFLPNFTSSLMRLPISVVRIVMPPIAELLVAQKEMKYKILSSPKLESQEAPKAVIFSALCDRDIPDEERSIGRLLDEGITIIFAGTATTPRALSVAMFYLLDDRLHLKKLREELGSLPPVPSNNYSMAQLEPLPYLTGVVNESLRLSFGPVGRFPRVASYEALKYGDYTIPPGTPVSQSTYFVHTDPAIYPNPYCFDPNRWIKAAQEGVPLKRFLVSFSKGTRQCLGIQMAHTELYLTIATLVRSFNMELHGTTIDDIKIHHVRGVGYPRKVKNSTNKRGEIMVKVTGLAQSTSLL